jgi:hypothetical protein
MEQNDKADKHTFSLCVLASLRENFTFPLSDLRNLTFCHFHFSFIIFPMSSIPELLSPYESIDGLVYFPRMLSKIRLHAAGKLPEDYIPYLGEAFEGRTFDARCCRLLGVPYEQLVARTLESGTDAEILAWAREHGNNPSEEQITIWSTYAAKRGWRDDGAAHRAKWATDEGFDPAVILTFFDLIDAIEGRPLNS